MLQHLSKRVHFNNIDPNTYMNLLNKAGFSQEDDYKEDINRLSKIKFGVAKILDFDVEFDKMYKIKPMNFYDRISTLASKMMKGMKNIELNGRKITMIIDGMDDVLR